MTDYERRDRARSDAGGFFCRRYRRRSDERWRPLVRWWPLWVLVAWEVAVWLAWGPASWRARQWLSLAGLLPLALLVAAVAGVPVLIFIERHRPKFSLRTLVLMNLLATSFVALWVDLRRNSVGAGLLPEYFCTVIFASALILSIRVDLRAIAERFSRGVEQGLHPPPPMPDA